MKSKRSLARTCLPKSATLVSLRPARFPAAFPSYFSTARAHGLLALYTASFSEPRAANSRKIRAFSFSTCTPTSTTGMRKGWSRSMRKLRRWRRFDSEASATGQAPPSGGEDSVSIASTWRLGPTAARLPFFRESR